MPRVARVVIADVAHHVTQRGNGRQFILAETFQHGHGRYAAYWNVAHATSGHVWQGRFYSCPMDPGHL